MNNYKIALAQIHSYLGNIDLNFETHLKYIKKAKRLGVKILVFPELSLTGYLLRDLAYEVSEKCGEKIDLLKEYSKDICLIVGVVEEHRIGIYRNSMAIICDGQFKGYVPKLYLPDYDLFEESRYFQEGDMKDIKVFSFDGLNFGVAICEDAWHPEPIELLAKMGADTVFISASSPLRGLYNSDETFIERVWESINVTRAIENTVFIGFVNRVGVEDEEYFWGGSMFVQPDGKILVKGLKMKEDLVIANIDYHVLRKARRFSSFKTFRKDIHLKLGEL